MARNSALAVALLLLAACGGESGTGPNTPPPPPPPPPPGTGAMTVNVDGQAFGPVSYSQAIHALSGGYHISVQSVSGVNSKVITILLSNISGTGTYPLGTGGNVEGGLATYVENGAGWSTALSGEAGSITLTTLSDTRIAGTFRFTATEHTGGATGTRTLTSGSFDLPVNTTGTFDPVPESRKNTLYATVDGQSYVASTVASTSTTSGVYVVAVNNTKYSLSFGFNGLTAPGTYPVSAVPGVLVVTTVGPPPGAPTTGPLCCWSSGLGGNGSVVITSVTPTRVIGTFAFTISASSGGATEPMVVTDGSFSFGRDPAP